MSPFIKRDPNAIHPTFHVVREKPFLFAALYSIPVLSVIAAFMMHRHWAYLFSLAMAFSILLFLIESFQKGAIETNQGRFFRDTQPFGFWGSVLIWTFAFVFLGVFWPLGYARQEARKSQKPNSTVEPTRAPEGARSSP